MKLRHVRNGAKVPRKLRKMPRKYQLSLEYQLCELLSDKAGERGYTEGAVDTLARIIHERDRAFTVLALNALKP